MKYDELTRREKQLIALEYPYKADRQLWDVTCGKNDFDTKKFDIMEKALYAKFIQNPDAAELLKSTGDSILIKSCPVCYKCGFN